MPPLTRALVAALAILLLPSPSKGADAPPKTELVGTFLTLAEEHRNAKRYKEALTVLQSAWSLEQRPEIASNRGIVAARLSLHREAAEFLSRCLRSPPPAQSAEQERILRAQLAMSRQSVASISIDVNVTGADVFVDGRMLGQTPLGEQVFVNPGKHAIRAELAGRIVSETIVVDAGDSRALRLHIPPYLTTIDSATPPPKPMDLGPAVLSSGITAGVSAAVAAGTLIASRALYSEATDDLNEIMARSAAGCANPVNRASCQSYRSNYNTAGTLQDTSVVAAVVAGVAGAVTVTLAIMNNRRKSRMNARAMEAKFTW